jgi:hypothetical protein
MTVAPGGCTLQLFSIRPKCDGDHRLLPVPRSTIQFGDIYLAPGGGTWHQNQKQLGSHMSSG